MKRQIAIIVMVLMVLTIMSAIVSCGPKCEHSLTKHDKIEATCTQKGTDEYYSCTECGGLFSDAEAQNPITKPVALDRAEHVDADKNHKCDECHVAVGIHKAEGGHNCTYCGKQLSGCVDTDANHSCDICSKYVGTHEAEAGKHTCAHCGKVVTACADTDDHNCDVCGEVLSSCADEDKDHACDLCGATGMGDHESAEGGHSCDYCGGPVTECVDYDTNHECDICGYTVGEHVATWDHYCEYCWEPVSGCYDEDLDHYCDVCYLKLGIHKEPKDGHVCEYCGYVFSECTAREDDGDCTTPIYCTKCPEIVVPAKSHDIVWSYDETGHSGECANAGCNYTIAHTNHTTEPHCHCECGYAFVEKCEVCGNCLDESCVLCATKCGFIDMNKVITFAPNINLGAPEGPDGQAKGYTDVRDNVTASQIVLPNGAKAVQVTVNSAIGANSGVSFLNNNGTLTSYGKAGYNCGVPLINGQYTILRMHFTNTGDSEVTFKFSNIDYYYDYGAATLTLAPGETKSALVYTSHGDSLGLNSQIVFTKAASKGASVAMWGEFVANENLTSVSISVPANKLNFVVGDTFTADGLILKANGYKHDRVYIGANYVTNLDGHVFTAEDVGTKAVIVEFDGKLVWYTIEVADHIHNVEYIPEKAPVACQQDGVKAHYACTVEGCGLYFTDATGNTVAGAPDKISCHTSGDESQVLPGADILCSGCNQVVGQRSMENWVLYNMSTNTSSIGSNIKNGKMEFVNYNGIDATKVSFSAGTIGATTNSAFYLANNSNQGDRQTDIPQVAKNTSYKRIIMFQYINLSNEAVTMNLQNDRGGKYGMSKVTVPANGTAIGTYTTDSSTSQNGANWHYYYVDCSPKTDISFIVYGYMYVNDGETDNPSIRTAAKKLTYKVGETFSSEGLVLNANITSVGHNVIARTGYTTNYDGYTFTAADAGTHTVTVKFAGKTVNYSITVEGESTFDCASGLHDFKMYNDEALFDKMVGSEAYYYSKCSLCGTKSAQSSAAPKVAFVPHNRGIENASIEYVTLENGQIAAKLTINSNISAGSKITTIESSGAIGGTNVYFPINKTGRRVYMEMTASADIGLTWQPEFYGDKDAITLSLKAGETNSTSRIIAYDTTSNSNYTASELPYEEFYATTAIPAGTVIYITGYFYAPGDVSGVTLSSSADRTVFRVGETFSSAGVSLAVSSSDSLFSNVRIFNVTTNLDGYVFTEEDAGKLIDVIVYFDGYEATYRIAIAK